MRLQLPKATKFTRYDSLRQLSLNHENSNSILVGETTVKTVWISLQSDEPVIDFPMAGKVPRKEALNITRWLRPAPNGRQTVVLKSAPRELIRQLKAKRYGGQWFVNSVKLNHFLNTTFSFTIQSKLNFPLTRFVIPWIEAGVDLKRIILLLLLTEGGGTQHRNLYFYNRNQLYHKLLVESVWHITEEYPTSFMIPSKYTTKTGETRTTPDTEYWNKKIIQIMCELTPSLKCKPAVHQSKSAYLQEPQPDARYLLRGSKFEKEIMSLLIIGTEGYITPFNNQNGFCSATIGFRCSHPVLLPQFIKIFRDINIHMTLIRDKKTFSGLGGAHNQSYDTGKKILELHLKHGDLMGSIHGNSRFHEGFKKSELLIACLDCYLQQKESMLNRHIARRPLHELLNLRIESQLLMPIEEIIRKLNQNSRVHRNIRSKKKRRVGCVSLAKSTRSL
jgi:hypothetical protein